MGGKMSPRVKHQLLQRISKLLPCVDTSLFGIQFDQLGLRFQAKLNMIDESRHCIRPRDEFVRASTNVLLLNAASDILDYHRTFVYNSKDDILKLNTKSLLKTLSYLIKNYRNGDVLAKIACKLLAPLNCTLIGSLLASRNIQNNDRISPEAFAWFESGLNSDVASGKLKFASMIYCTGDMVRSEALLCDIEQQYRVHITEPICGCYDFQRPWIRKGFGHISKEYDVEAAKSIIAFCVCFFRSEIYCIPHELQYELFRSIPADLPFRTFWDNNWMDCAVVDSLPYLYYLQYKTYSNLQKPFEQQNALRKLTHAINTERNLGHKETAYNLLGQCMEHQNRYVDALSCYMLSLRIRARNNAAKIHLCKCLARVMTPNR
ncbi:uncharacterized protein LOC132742577 isoform X1 [Ruditapes philippinarum]|uniref:uncharacterized protein LOC132742577 isoform X1 n=1 Tax=Ruditapes philippinarum TaxID=129788 RepID=UPI00295BC5DE|nr:uncharacterized protein LOC132742577 isoform X1 [Ruditapes philippinarum]XP_060587004.1 uncharacterized protein LOC132742577 isoform X1 [Ruditapes philippinarum]